MNASEYEASVVRPYMMTGGRTTASGSDLAYESMVTLTDNGRSALTQLRFEQGRIGRLVSAQAQSIAEIAASLHVPIGVSRVLCADMVATKLLEHHSAPENPADDVSLLTRLINGVRSL